MKLKYFYLAVTFFCSFICASFACMLLLTVAVFSCTFVCI
jgi:hypothetical protein